MEAFKKSIGTRLIAVLCCALMAVTFSACGKKDGGNTTCENYLKLSTKDQKDVIKNYLKERDGSDPSMGKYS